MLNDSTCNTELIDKDENMKDEDNNDNLWEHQEHLSRLSVMGHTEEDSKDIKG